MNAISKSWLQNTTVGVGGFSSLIFVTVVQYNKTATTCTKNPCLIPGLVRSYCAISYVSAPVFISFLFLQLKPWMLLVVWRMGCLHSAVVLISLNSKFIWKDCDINQVSVQFLLLRFSRVVVWMICLKIVWCPSPCCMSRWSRATYRLGLLMRSENQFVYANRVIAWLKANALRLQVKYDQTFNRFTFYVVKPTSCDLTIAKEFSFLHFQTWHQTQYS